MCVYTWSYISFLGLKWAVCQNALYNIIHCTYLWLTWFCPNCRKSPKYMSKDTAAGVQRCSFWTEELFSSVPECGTYCSGQDEKARTIKYLRWTEAQSNLIACNREYFLNWHVQQLCCHVLHIPVHPPPLQLFLVEVMGLNMRSSISCVIFKNY